MSRLVAAAVLAGVFSVGVYAQKAEKPAGSVPILYTTDLYHPHCDPDDHYDLATLFAIPQFDIRGIVIDTGPRGKGRPGLLPIRQMEHLTGRKVPCATGLAENLASPTDDGSKQPKDAQPGVELILKVLKESKEPVTVFTVGSLRDVAAAYNREPALLEEKVGRLYVNAGNSGGGEEWNVKLDRHAYVRILQSDLPVYWVPCFGSDGYQSLWAFRQGDVLGQAPPRVQNFFLYALRKMSDEEHDPIKALDTPLNAAATEPFWKLDRRMWCTGAFLHAAGMEDASFSFKPLRFDIDSNGIATPRKEGRISLPTFHVDTPVYPLAMQKALRCLLEGLPLASARAAGAIEEDSIHAVQDSEWTVYIEDEEGSRARRGFAFLPARTLLENYIENIRTVCPWNVGGMQTTEEHPLHPKNLKVEKIGQWYDYTVFDVRNPKVHHKSIILKDQERRYRILYIQFWGSAGSPDNPSFYAKASEQTVLASVTLLPNTGHALREYYFVFDERTRLPVSLSLEPIACKLLEILPEGHSVWKDGGFDVQKMAFSHAVWKKGDGNCCPSGGKIDLQLDLRDNKLVVIDAIYDPEHKWR